MGEGGDDETKHIAKTACDTTKNSLTKRTIVPSKIRESKQTKFTTERYDTKKQDE